MTPTDISLHQPSRILTIRWPDDISFYYSCEYLRVYSPSAEVRGHGQGQAVLQTGKEQVNITHIDPVGHYAIKIVFDDGHDSGLYDWKLLRTLGENMEEYWSDYLQRCHAAGYKREEKE